MKALLKKSAAAEPFSFTFVDDSGKMVLRSENYKAKDSASKGINSVKKNCTEDKRYVLKESANGMFFFNVKSANGQVVATSAMYPSEQERTEAINHIKSNAPACEVEEQLGG
jgi:uncharacterized protein YegP (UPF0339 family)